MDVIEDAYLAFVSTDTGWAVDRDYFRAGFLAARKMAVEACRAEAVKWESSGHVAQHPTIRATDDAAARALNWLAAALEKLGEGQ